MANPAFNLVWFGGIINGPFKIVMVSRVRFVLRGFGDERGLGGLSGRGIASVFESEFQRFIRVKRLLDDLGDTLGYFINSKQAAYFNCEPIAMGIENTSEPSVIIRSMR